MEEYSIVFTDQAERELDSIVGYLTEKWSEKVKTDFLAILSDKLRNLSQMPFMYRASLTEPDVRECIVNSNTILYYRIIDKNVELLSLQNSRLDR